MAQLKKRGIGVDAHVFSIFCRLLDFMCLYRREIVRNLSEISHLHTHNRMDGKVILNQ